MKLSELIHAPALDVQVENALKSMDWDFDVDGNDDFRLERGTRELKRLEVMVGALHSAKPELASALWEAYCPYAQPGSLPTSILRK